MAGIELHACRHDGRAGPLDPAQLLRHPLATMSGMRVRTGVHLTHSRSHTGRGLNLAIVCVDKDAGHNARICQLPNDILNVRLLRHDIKPTFGGHFVPSLWNQHGQRWLHSARNGNHLRHRSHFKVQLHWTFLGQSLNIGVLNVPTVFTQVNRDAIRPTEDRLGGSLDGVRFVGTPRLPNGGHMINVDAKLNHGGKGAEYRRIALV